MVNFKPNSKYLYLSLKMRNPKTKTMIESVRNVSKEVIAKIHKNTKTNKKNYFYKCVCVCDCCTHTHLTYMPAFGWDARYFFGTERLPRASSQVKEMALNVV